MKAAPYSQPQTANDSNLPLYNSAMRVGLESIYDDFLNEHGAVDQTKAALTTSPLSLVANVRVVLVGVTATPGGKVQNLLNDFSADADV
jgi:hypothetical protein